MMFEFEGLKFRLPFFTLLSGPMAAAKPIFAQKFIVKWLEGRDSKVIYFATSTPVDGIVRNLKILGLNDRKLEDMVFFDYNPEYRELKKINDSLYVGDFSRKEQLKRALELIEEGSITIIPSFTLLLIGSDDKRRLGEILMDHLVKRFILSFIAVNSGMFQEVNEMLKDKADNVIEFIKYENDVYFKVVKFKGEAPRDKIKFEFPMHLFRRTKKEVAKRTSQIILKKSKERKPTR